MPTITSIVLQKNQKRVNIYLDGKFGFGLDLENFVKLGLKAERELSKEEVEDIIKKASFQKVYEKILKFASLRPRSEREFKDWLKKHKVDRNFQPELFNRLKKLNFLDDKKFALWWVKQRKEFRLKSKKELIQELRLKGIPKDIIEEVLSKIDIDEINTARNLLEKKKYLWEGLKGVESRKRKLEFLLRHGFDWEVINKVVGVFPP